MKRQNPFFTHFIAITVFIALALACKSSKQEPIKPAENTNVSPTPTATSSPTTQTLSAKDISGEYESTGTNPNGQGTYVADLKVTKHGEVYQFSWDTGGNKYDGVGVQTDNFVSVAFTEGTNGKGCGVKLYKINSDGSLDGKLGYWGKDSIETEKAVRTSGTDLAGEYQITGKNQNDEEYKSKLTISPSGPGFTFKWKGANSFNGGGVRLENMVTAGFGADQCGFVAYEIKPDGSLVGKWGAGGVDQFGTEKAIKK
ncbi:MAG: hypothetical protein K1X72_04580 [Pyrinomonadaceae bacterium]|nr:hypothetical protein [Pyrinomonadaceae bacterium]